MPTKWEGHGISSGETMTAKRGRLLYKDTPTFIYYMREAKLFLK